jgi:hypothetical protein
VQPDLLVPQDKTETDIKPHLPTTLLWEFPEE